MRQFDNVWMEPQSLRRVRYAGYLFSVLSLAGCGDGIDIPVSDNSAVVTRSVNGSIQTMSGQMRALSLTFNSSDELALAGLVVTTDLTELPSGWSAPSSFACAFVSSGSGCVLNLTYSPTAFANSSFELEYSYSNSAGARKSGRETISYAATADNNVVATASPSGQINAIVGTGSQPVTVTFTTEDGGPASALHLLTRLDSLPAGWGTTAQGFDCAIVSTGNGCLLPLTYTPAGKGAGTLTLEYSYVSNSGLAKSGAIDLSYTATTHNNVVSTVAPAGQVTAVVGSVRPVTVTFAPDDGNPITDFSVTSDLAQLPAAWSSSSANFSCATVSAGNGCELALAFAPTVVGGGTLRLNYQYRDDSNVLKTGSLDVDYSGTTYNNVTTTVAPSAPIAAVAGSAGQSVTVTFGTDDGHIARSLQLTTDLSTLPLGWTSAVTAHSCNTVSGGTPCSLPLTYAPTVVGSGNVTLAYSYRDNAGVAKTGSVIIGYASTAQNSVSAQVDPVSVAAEIGTTHPVAVGFVSDDGVVAGFSITSDLSSLPTGWSASGSSFSCASVTTGAGCELDLTYAPTVGASGTLALNYQYTNNAGIVRTATLQVPYSARVPVLYVTNHDPGANYVLMCAVLADGSLSPCEQTHSRAYDISHEIINLADVDYRGGRLVLAQTARSDGLPFVWGPSIYSDGTIDWTYGRANPVPYPRTIVLNPAITYAYVFGGTPGLGLCALGSTAGFGACNTIATPHDYEKVAFSADGTIAYGAYANMGGNWSIEACAVAADATLGACAEVHVGDSSKVMEVVGNRLYSQNSFGGLDVCPINADHSLGTCVRTAPAEIFMDMTLTATNVYLTTSGNTLRRCPLNADGTVGACVTLNDPNFLVTTGIAVR